MKAISHVKPDECRSTSCVQKIINWAVSQSHPLCIPTRGNSCKQIMWKSLDSRRAVARVLGRLGFKCKLR